MADFPYTQNPASLKKFLTQIVQTAGVPSKVTNQYLITVGYKSSNDRRLIPILKQINFVDSSGSPTARWQDFRNKQKAGAVLADAIQDSYPGLFETYPDAYKREPETIRNYFGGQTKVGDATLGFMVSTFRSLCELGDFNETISESPTEKAPLVKPLRGAVAQENLISPPIVNINIQLQLPPTSDMAVWDSLFSSMKKYLFPGND